VQEDSVRIEEDIIRRPANNVINCREEVIRASGMSFVRTFDSGAFKEKKASVKSETTWAEYVQI
jgi:hypothetical protein